MNSLFIFRRDLRLEDNTALLKALDESEKVIPCFIFDDRQTKNNEYFSENAFQFMIESLKDLEEQLKEKKSRLYIFKGLAHEVVEKIIRENNIKAVYVNKDYTPFSEKRDMQLKKTCEKHNINFLQEHDYLLHKPGDIMTKEKKPYTVYTFFYKKAIEKNISLPKKLNKNNFFIDKIKGEISLDSVTYDKNPDVFVHGGRKNALAILENISDFKDYDKKRDYPSEKTTNLSGHHKFGTISIRESYHAVKKSLGKEHTLIREIYWRDFFTHIAYFFPHVFGKEFKEKYQKIIWKDDNKKFQAWCQGKTGYPIVDAGMRQLNKTGFMHNRVRMITASFLVKDLHIDWRLGEKYFAQKLLDYDPCVNNGNWQWAASTGCDAQPYFRIFNPWSQGKKHDPECKYIKKYVPELSKLECDKIHSTPSLFADYIKPVVIHKIARAEALEMYKKV